MENIAVPSDYLTPGTFVKINFSQGRSNAGGGSRDAIYYGAMVSTGTATVNTKYKVTGDPHAITLFGAKSPLRWALKSHFKCWQGGTVYAVPHAATSGGSPVTASATITFANGSATAAGFVTVTAENEDIVVGFPSGAAIGDIASAVSEAINGKDWIVSASPSSGVVTVSAPIAGTSQNGIYRLTATISSGVGTTCTVSASTLGSGAEGTTTELSLLSAALSANVADSSYYIGICHKQGSTQNGYLTAHINAKLAANLSNRSRGFIGGVDAKATLQASAIAMNHKRSSLVSEPSSEYDPAYLVGQAVAWTQASERLRPHANMTSGFVNEEAATWHLLPIRTVSDRMTGSDINDMMADGLWVIRSEGPRSFLNASLLTSSKDATGLINDRRCWSTHVVSIADYLATTIENRCAVSFAGFNLADDTYSGALITTKYKKLTLYPSLFKAFLRDEIERVEDLGMVTHVNDVMIPSITTAIDNVNANRMDGVFDLRCVTPAMSFGIEINEVTPG